VFNAFLINLCKNIKEVSLERGQAGVELVVVVVVVVVP
jgi:hypothetical protein